MATIEQKADGSGGTKPAATLPVVTKSIATSFPVEHLTIPDLAALKTLTAQMPENVEKRFRFAGIGVDPARRVTFNTPVEVSLNGGKFLVIKRVGYDTTGMFVDVVFKKLATT